MDDLPLVTANLAGIDRTPITGAHQNIDINSPASRREFLTFVLAAGVATALMLAASTGVSWAAARSAPVMESAYRNKLTSLLRKRGVRGGLDAKIGAILGLYNRGDNILVSRMSMRKDNRILTFGRVGMRNRELYYWGFQPNVNVLHTYFFLTNWELVLVARGAELVDRKATALPPARGAALFAEVIKDWTTILDTL